MPGQESLRPWKMVQSQEDTSGYREGASPEIESKIARREFLKRVGAAGVALGATSLWGAACAPVQPAPAAPKPAAAPSGAAAKPSGVLKTLKIAEAAHTAQYSPLYFANRMGFFREQGIEADITTAGTRIVAMAAVIAGDAHFSVHDPAEAALARTKGAPVKVVAPIVMRNAAFLIVRNDSPAKSLADLKGLRVVCPKEPSTGYSTVLDLLTRYNFEMVERNIWRPKGSTAKADQVEIIEADIGTELAAISAGRADVGYIFPPAEAIAEVEGNMRVLASILVEFGPFFNTSFNALEQTIRSDPETMQGFVNAMTKSFKWAHKRPEDAVRVMKEEFSRMNPVAVERAIRRFISEGAWPDSPVISKQAFDANFNNLLIKTKHPAAGMKYEELVVTEFAEKAHASVTV